MTSQPHLVVVGGGTAGHVLPALPVIQQLRKDGWRASFIGTHSGLEAQLVAPSEVPFFAVSAGKLRRYWSWQNLTDVFRIVAGIGQAWRLLRRLRPDVVFSKGGFVAVPVVLAAWLRRIPVVAHESDLSPGLANRLCTPFVDTFCVSFADTPVGGRARRVHSGTPLREEIVSGDAERGRAQLGFERDLPVVVVTGGSLGADRLNAAVLAQLPVLTERYNVYHVCGPGKLPDDPTQPGYVAVEYVSQGWGDILAAADVIVSRAGANALFELLALAKPNVLVPLSAQASRGDQLENAEYARAHGASLVLHEGELDDTALLQTIAQALQEAPSLAANARKLSQLDGAQRIATELQRLAVV